MISPKAYEIRKKVEQEILPDFLHSQKSALFASILDKQGKFFSDIYNCMFFDPTGQSEYKSNEFTVEIKSFAHQDTCFYILIVGMPKAEEVSLCRRVYFCYDRESEITMYFTSEKAESGFKLCGINCDGERLSYGNGSDEVMRELADVVRAVLTVLDKN